MTGQLLYQSDFKDLTTYLQVLQRLPALTRSFKVHLDQVPLARHSTYPITELRNVLERANRDWSGWSALLPKLMAMHRRLDAMTAELTQFSGSATQDYKLAEHLRGSAGDRLIAFESEFDNEEQTVQKLTLGICTILPRLIDFLNDAISRYSRKFGLKPGDPHRENLANALPLSFGTQDAIDAQERLFRAQGYAYRALGWYIRAYTAARNLGAYLLRMWALLWACVGSIIGVRKAETPLRRRLETGLLLVNVLEIQRLSKAFDTGQDLAV
ncbi:hypothetical protein BKM09_007795 [Pseudomonas amygdali pv. morsprunorum]|nr:hypothetical protein [Pseudomonas amygdali]POY82101.1 hypothetical protein BKM09_007795 [Pseudomonas amygdali pv. morsprunorum]